MKCVRFLLKNSFSIKCSQMEDDVAHEVVEGFQCADGTADLSLTTQDSNASGGLP